MRKEVFDQDTVVHIIQRGARGAPIVRDESDRWRFLRLLRYLNDENVPRNWDRDITPEHVRSGFQRPDSWSEQRPYVSILAFCLMDNHFHLLVRPKKENGIPEFMQRFSTSMAAYFNTKYREKGSLFQGPYKARVVDSDVYLQYLAAYIQVKNPFERYPKGLSAALVDFDDAYQWAQGDPFSSLADYVRARRSPLIDFDVLDELFEPDNFHTFAKDVMEGRYQNITFDAKDLELD